MRDVSFLYTECQQQRKEAVSKAGEKNPSQLLTQYDLLSSGLGSSTNSVEIREPQQPQEQPNQERANEAEVEQMVNVVLGVQIYHNTYMYMHVTIGSGMCLFKYVSEHCVYVEGPSLHGERKK